MSVVRVLGVGGPVGDDAVGLEVVRELVRRGLPEGVEVHEVLEPSRIVSLLEGADHVVLVDALLGGGAPGSVRRLRLEDLEGARPLSTHGVSVAQAIELASLVSPGERSIDIVGVSIARAAPLASLSPEVARAVPAVADLVIRALTSRGGPAPAASPR